MLIIDRQRADEVSYSVGLTRKDVAGMLVFKLGDPSYRWMKFFRPGRGEEHDEGRSRGANTGSV